MAASLPNGDAAPPICTKVLTIDTELHIRHGSALTLRRVRWLVTDQTVGELLLGRPVLKKLGLNTRDILAAAAEKHSGVVDLYDVLYSKPEPKGKVSRILEGFYHSHGGADDADLDDKDGWLDLRPEDPAEKRKVLDRKLDEARSCGMSDKGLEKLRKLLIEFDDVNKTKLDRGEPADIAPLKVTLKKDAIPVRSKKRHYPPPKKEFMTKYVKQLLKLDFVKKATAPA